MLQKDIYQNEYMHGQQKLGETSLQTKNEFYSNFNMEDFTNEYYKHAK